MTSCVEWQGPFKNNGYGRRKRNGEDWLMHRWVMAQIHGEEAIRGKVVMHLCDNRACYRYEHLAIGTQQDNHADMVAKRRHQHGEESSLAKLTNEQAYEIFTSTEPGGALASKYGVSQQTVCDIRKGRTWTHSNKIKEITT